MNIRSKRAISQAIVFCAALTSLVFATASCRTTQTEERGNSPQTNIRNPVGFSEKTILDSTRAMRRANRSMPVAKKHTTGFPPSTIPESQLHVDARFTMHDGTYVVPQSNGEFSDFWKYATLAAVTLGFAGVALYLQKRSERTK